MRKNIRGVFNKNKSYFFILLIISISIIIGNAVVFFCMEDLAQISNRTNPYFLMIYMIIGVISFGVVEYFRLESFTIRDILMSIATLFLVYFIPLMIMWDDGFARSNINKKSENYLYVPYQMLEGMFRGWESDVTILQSDWFVKYRYVALVFLILLVVYLIKAILIERHNCRDGFMLFLVVVIMSTSTSYLYLDKEAQRKEEYTKTMDEICKYIEALDYLRVLPTEEKMRYYLWKAQEEDESNRFGIANDLFRDLVSGESWQSIYEEGKRSDFDEFKQYLKYEVDLSEEEGMNRLNNFLKLSEKERVKIANKEVDLFLEELREHLINKSFKSYFGIYTENNILNTREEYISDKEEELKAKYFVDYIVQ